MLIVNSASKEAEGRMFVKPGFDKQVSSFSYTIAQETASATR